MHVYPTMVSEKIIKDEYQANKNPQKHSEKNSICWSKVNLSIIGNKIIPYHASLF